MSGSAMKPHLTTSASPARRSKSGSVSRLDRSARTPDGRVEGADEVLALGGVDAGLAADGRVDHAEQRGGDLDDLHPAQPGGGDEAGEVGDRSPADADDGVGAGEAGLAEHLPAERGDLGGLGLLAVGHLGGDGLVADRGEVLAHRVARGPQRARVDDEDAADVGAEQGGQPVEQPVADDDVVGLGALHPDDGGRAHGAGTSRSGKAASTCSATCSGSRSVVTTTADGEGGVDRPAHVHQAGPGGAGGVEQQRARGVHADPAGGRGQADVEEDHPVPAQPLLGDAGRPGAPPPRASTPRCSASAAATAWRSSSRKAGSPW